MMEPSMFKDSYDMYIFYAIIENAWYVIKIAFISILSIWIIDMKMLY